MLSFLESERQTWEANLMRRSVAGPMQLVWNYINCGRNATVNAQNPRASKTIRSKNKKLQSALTQCHDDVIKRWVTRRYFYTIFKSLGMHKWKTVGHRLLHLEDCYCPSKYVRDIKRWLRQCVNYFLLLLEYNYSLNLHLTNELRDVFYRMIHYIRAENLNIVSFSRWPEWRTAKTSKWRELIVKRQVAIACTTQRYFSYIYVTTTDLAVLTILLFNNRYRFHLNCCDIYHRLLKSLFLLSCCNLGIWQYDWFTWGQLVA